MARRAEAPTPWSGRAGEGRDGEAIPVRDARSPRPRVSQQARPAPLVEPP